jgi:putative resolvase
MLTYVKLSEWARSYGVHPQTAYRWFREGKLPVPAERLPTGTIVVAGGVSSSAGPSSATVYARVSSHGQRADLDRQVARLTNWATANGMAVAEVVTEVGSGMDGRRPKFARVLADPAVATIVVEHRDRLARFGVEHLEAALSAQGRKVLVTDEGEVTDDLVRDVTEVLTSFCARLYGRRGARNRAEKALRCAEHDVGPSLLGVG